MSDMPLENRIAGEIPARAGVGLKPQHYHAIMADKPALGFFEVHAENYMGDGGPPHRYLNEIRKDYPLSLHGVGLSIGAAQPLDKSHLARLRGLMSRYEPGLFSEHLAWSSHGENFFNDLLPVAYTGETLQRIVSHIDQVQDSLGRQMLLENPSTYVAFAESTWEETAFIGEVQKRTGCGLLLDVNNVHVACTNQLWDPLAYLAAYPLAHVREIHLAGYASDRDEQGRNLLIDSHNTPVEQVVWDLYAHVIAQIGPRPTLIEWDNDLPAWPVLLREAQVAEAVMQGQAKVHDAAA
jgi:uncharacterized protein (UPF0276 family)